MSFPRAFFAVLLACMAAAWAATSMAAPAVGSVPSSAVHALAPHPRVLLAPGQEQQIRQRIATDAVARQLHTAIMQECDRLLTVAPLQRVLSGKRLLDVSREALRRIFYLSYAHRISGEDKYLKRAEQEMLAVAAFSDWNPPHFLDTAEMSLAMGIGYDWLYDGLSVTSRQRIKDAIVQKALDVSLAPGGAGWASQSHNWNQVSNTGLALGAMAIYEDEPAKAQRIIDRAIQTVVLPMRDYAPDGAYPEGYSYWGYGTSFNVLLISALENMLGSDFGLAAQPGFLKTAHYIAHMSGATGMPFNYADSNGKPELHPAAFWLAQRQNDPSLLWVERALLQKTDWRSAVTNRLLPATLLWLGTQNLDAITPPAAKAWIGQGKTPVALFRTSWTDPNAIYVGVKGGSPSTNHAHMDVGSFVMESDGVRWAMDFGMQPYESLESKKVDLWNLAQNSSRWRVFRYTNLTHNTLAVNGQLQRVDGMGTLSDFSDDPQNMGVTVNLSSLYREALTQAQRRITIAHEAEVHVRDEVRAGAKDATVRWTLLTPATVTLLDPHTAELRKDGKKLRLHVDSPVRITLTTWPTTPPHDYDAANPGTTLIGFEARVPAQTQASWTVRLLTEKTALGK